MPIKFDTTQSDSQAGTSIRSDKERLLEVESRFLEHSIRSVEYDLERIRDNLGTTYTEDRDEPSPGEEQLLTTYQRERSVLQELLNNPRRQQGSLEGLLGDWLRHGDDRLAELGRIAHARGSYSAAFWEIDRERDIRSAILRDWWHWLRG